MIEVAKHEVEQFERQMVLWWYYLLNEKILRRSTTSEVVYRKWEIFQLVSSIVSKSLYRLLLLLEMEDAWPIAGCERGLMMIAMMIK